MHLIIFISSEVDNLMTYIYLIMFISSDVDNYYFVKLTVHRENLSKYCVFFWGNI